MGIPHLLAQIRPYARSISWLAQPNDTDEQKLENLVIDGPALAYHIYHQSLATKSDALTALDAIPTYIELGKAVVAWLESLERFGLYVKHIFFDGHLPKSKTNVRYERLSKYLLQLKIFRSSTIHLPAGIIPHHMVRPHNMTTPTGQKVPAKLTALPAPPFLVPSVMDALFTSKYSNRTNTVPCEAEAQCTNNDLLEERDIILTSDSDLILLSKCNRVMFFGEIGVKTRLEFNDTCYGLYYEPTELVNKLECPDLIRLAYLLSLHPHRSIKELAKKAAQNVSSTDYDQFRAQFLPENQYLKYAIAVNDPDTAAEVLRRLDPRVSELIQQWRSTLGLPRLSPQDQHTLEINDNVTSRHMFLPFLIDDPTRSSAWRPSKNLRLVAYSILAMNGPRFNLMEVDRRGDRIVGTHVPLIMQREILEESCLNLLKDLSELDVSMQNANSWKFLALSQVLKSFDEEGGSLPAREIVKELCYSSSKKLEWSHVHLSAQVEGYLYSLRILMQILQVHLIASLEHELLNMNTLQELFRRLQRLPPLHEIIDRASGGLRLEEVNRDELEQFLVSWYSEGQIGTAVNKVSSQSKKNQKREKKASHGVGRPVACTHRPSANIYSLLEDT